MRYADIFVPQIRLGFDELTHERDATRVVHELDLNTRIAHPVLTAFEGRVLADDHAPKPVQHGSAAAHGAG